MHRSCALAFFAAATVVAGASAANAATVLSVNASSLCASTGCFTDTLRTYKQTWSAGQLGGGAVISALALDRSILGSMQDYAVRISFQDSAGNTVTSWGAFTLAVLSGQVVTLGGESIAWDASMGDLTLKLDLLIPDKGGVGGGGGFFACGGGFSGGHGWWQGGGPVAVAQGPSIVNLPPGVHPADLVPSVLAVPEPGAWALMLMGFMGAGAMLRTHRRAAPLKV
jgi:hypothetical protein